MHHARQSPGPMADGAAGPYHRWQRETADQEGISDGQADALAPSPNAEVLDPSRAGRGGA